MKKIDFDNDSIKKNILQAALPMLAAQILSLLYNIVDRIYIARIPDMGTTALGAVGLCFPIIMLTIAFSNLFGSGGAPLFSIKRGMSDDRAANTIMNTSFTMVCTFAVVFTALCMIFAKPLLILFGASENALKYALPYLLIYLIGTLPSMISTGMNPFINAQGYSTTGMLSVAIGAVANLVLDPLFIFGFNFGIKGAAIATVIAQILSALYVLHFLRKKAELKVRLMTLSEFGENTHHKPWNLRLCHAAHKQPGIYMLQQCAFSDRWRFVHIGNDNCIKHQADGRDSNLCNCGGFISCFKLQLWRQKAGPGEKIYFHYGTARASIYSCHVECNYTCSSCPDCYFQFRCHPHG